MNAGMDTRFDYKPRPNWVVSDFFALSAVLAGLVLWLGPKELFAQVRGLDISPGLMAVGGVLLFWIFAFLGVLKSQIVASSYISVSRMEQIIKAYKEGLAPMQLFQVSLQDAGSFGVVGRTITRRPLWLLKLFSVRKTGYYPALFTPNGRFYSLHVIPSSSPAPVERHAQRLDEWLTGLRQEESTSEQLERETGFRVKQGQRISRAGFSSFLFTLLFIALPGLGAWQTNNAPANLNEPIRWRQLGNNIVAQGKFLFTGERSSTPRPEVDESGGLKEEKFDWAGAAFGDDEKKNNRRSRSTSSSRSASRESGSNDSLGKGIGKVIGSLFSRGGSKDSSSTNNDGAVKMGGVESKEQATSNDPPDPNKQVLIQAGFSYYQTLQGPELTFIDTVKRNDIKNLATEAAILLKFYKEEKRASIQTVRVLEALATQPTKQMRPRELELMIACLGEAGRERERDALKEFLEQANVRKIPRFSDVDQTRVLNALKEAIEKLDARLGAIE
jgi:hypothetical protein